MAAFSCCCCCGPVTLPSQYQVTAPEISGTKVPSDWSQDTRDSCCYAVISTPPSGLWTNICSAPTHTESRLIEYYGDYYLMPYPVVAAAGGDSSSIICTINKTTGESDCTYEGNPPPPCDLPEELCATMYRKIAIYRERVLVARWRPTKITTYLYRANLKCGSEETATCKFVLASVMEIQYFFGHLTNLQSEGIRTTSASGCCNPSPNLNSNSPLANCDTLANVGAGTLNGPFTAIVMRRKQYNSLPTGSITFSPGDVLDCDTHVACGGVGGLASIQLNSSDTAWFLPWTDPTCQSVNGFQDCRIIYDFGNGTCAYFSNGTIPTTNAVLPDPASGLNIFEVPLLVNCTRTCTQIPSNSSVTIPDKILKRTVCRNLTFNRAVVGYTPRSLFIDPTWTVNLSA